MKSLLLGLFLAGSPVPAKAPARQPFQWEVPNAVSAFDVHGKLEAMGVPVTLHVAAVKMPLPDLLNFYARGFASAGLVVDPAPKVVAGYVTLTALDPDKLVTYTVLLHEFTGGITRVIMGSADHAQRRRIEPANAFAPVMPGAADLVTADVEYGRTLSYLSDRPAGEVRAFYARELGQAGYAPGSAKDVFTRGNEELTLFLREEGGSRRVVLRAHRFGAPPPILEEK